MQVSYSPISALGLKTLLFGVYFMASCLIPKLSAHGVGPSLYNSPQTLDGNVQKSYQLGSTVQRGHAPVP